MRSFYFESPIYGLRQMVIIISDSENTLVYGRPMGSLNSDARASLKSIKVSEAVEYLSPLGIHRKSVKTNMVCVLPKK